MGKNFMRLTAAVSAAAVCVVSAPLSAGDAAKAAELKVRDPFFNFSSEYNYYESEHFQFIWGNNGADSAKVTAEFLEGNAKNLEAVWDVYMNDLSMEPPSQSVEDYLRDGNQYKTNIYISGTGLAGMEDDWAYMSWDSGGFAYMFCCVGAMQVNPPSWVMPHEFGHVMTAHQRGWNNNKYSYAWWEAIGNWYREQYLYSDYSTDDTGHGTDFFETYMKNLCFTFPCGRDYYASWAFLQYLTENPDNLDGYGPDFVKKMLQEGKVDEFPFDQVDRLANADIKETLGLYAARMAGLDFKKGAAYRARRDELFAQGDWNWQQVYTMLEPTQIKNEYTVPTERAPQFAGMNIVPLDVTNGDISVSFKGLSNAEGADWRACIVQQDDSGNYTYSELFGANGKGEVTVPYTGGKAYLAVIATPDLSTVTKYGLPGIYDDNSMFSESNVPFAAKGRYPYSVTFSDNVSITKRTVPTESANWWEQATYTPHPNGGGLVASTAKVDPTVYVGENAVVKGNAVVTGNVKLLDYAVVEGNSKVSDNVVISGYGMVAENAVVSGNARISDCGMVMGRANVSGNAKVIESALVCDTVTMNENAVAKGVAFIYNNGKLTGNGIVDGDYYDDSGKTIRQGTSYGWTSAQSYSDKRPYTDKLIYAYDLDSDSSLICEDRYTSTYALVGGNAKWESERTSAKGVLTFEGKDGVTIDKSAILTDDIEIQLGFLSRNTTDSEETLLSFTDEDSGMEITLKNGAVIMTINDGKSEQVLATAEGAIAPGVWNNLRVVIENGHGAILSGGHVFAEGDITITPAAAADSLDSGTAGLLGSGNNADSFRGSVDYLRIYSGQAEPATEVYTESETIIPEETTTPPETTTTAPETTTEAAPETTTETAPALEHSMWGDANCDGKVSIADATAILQSIVNSKKYALSKLGEINADVSENGDGVTTMDAFVIQQVDANLYTQEELPISYKK